LHFQVSVGAVQFQFNGKPADIAEAITGHKARNRTNVLQRWHKRHCANMYKPKKKQKSCQGNNCRVSIDFQVK